MKKGRKQFFIVLFFLSFANLAKGQTQGCLIGGELYNRSTYDVIPSLGCGWQTPRATGPIGWSSGQLTVCSWFGTPGGFNPRPITSCPIDDYIVFLVVISGGLGFIYLRRKNQFAFISVK